MGRKDKSVRVVEGEELSIGGKMRLARTSRKVSLTAMAKQLNYSKGYLSSVENGNEAAPGELVEKYEDALQLVRGTLTGSWSEIKRQLENSTLTVPVLSEKRETKEDRGEAPVVTNMGGRTQELATLKTWIIDESCKMVVIYGLGGIGKTTLASLVREQLKNEFEYVYWRSLQNAPPIENILKNAIYFLSDHQQATIPEHLNEQIETFIQYLQKHRCLILFDNVESVLSDDERAMAYYEVYSTLVQRLGETEHQSCILFTSRERPKEIIPLEGVKSMQLRGLELAEARKVLESEKIVGTDEEWAKFIQFYGGNILALKLVAEPIREIFGGNIAAFLEEEGGIVGDVDNLLQKQFSRLSELEQEIMYWLAIEREAVSRKSLLNDIIDAEKYKVHRALYSLWRRSMIEKNETSEKYSLQPVITEYMTNKFIEQVYEEINSGQIKLLASHTLIKAQADDYIRMKQTQFVLEPLAKRLENTLGKEECGRKIKHILVSQRARRSQVPNYVAGNLLDLLIQLKIDLQGYDFSQLVIRQAYMQGIALHNVNFAGARFEGSIFNDNFGNIFAVAVSADGEHMAATTDEEIRLWDLATATPKSTFFGHTDYVRAVAFHPDPKQHLLASGSEDQTIRLWDIETGQCLKTLDGHTSRVYSVAFHPDGKVIASGSHDCTIRLWDIETRQCLKILTGHEGRVYSVAFHPDGKVIASGSHDHTIRLWDIETGRCLKILTGHSEGIRSIAFSPDGKMIASGSEDRTVRLWDSTSGKFLKMLRLPEKMQQLHEDQDCSHEDRVWSVAFHPAGDIIVSGSDDQTLRLWHAKTGQCLNILKGTGSRVYSVAFNPREENMLVSGSDRQTIRIWNTANGECLKTLLGYGCRIYTLAFSPVENMLVSGSEDGTIRLWDASSNKQLQVLQEHTHWVWSIAFNSDGSMLASGSEDWTIRLWDAAKRTCIGVLKGENSYRVYCVAFSPDGQLLASGSTDQTIKLWDLTDEEKKCVGKLSEHTNRVRSVAFSPDGRWLASGSDDKTIKVWDPLSGACLITLEGHTDKVRSVAFSPDGRWLASGSDDKSIKIWDPLREVCLTTLNGHTSRVTSITFNRQGTMLASGSEDKTVCLWSTSKGDCLATFSCDTKIYSVAFNHDGNILASGGANGVIKLWDVRMKRDMQTLKSKGLYEGTNIAGVEGLTPSQRITLKALGAIEKQ